MDIAMSIQYQAKLAGVGGEFWINGNRLDSYTKWVWEPKLLENSYLGLRLPSGGKNPIAPF